LIALFALRSSVASYYLPYSSGLTKYLLKAFIPQFGDFVGFPIGANALTDLNCPVLNPEMIAPCPPILNPVIEMLVLLTGKKVETRSGSSLLIYENMLKLFLNSSDVAST